MGLQSVVVAPCKKTHFTFPQKSLEKTNLISQPFTHIMMNKIVALSALAASAAAAPMPEADAQVAGPVHAVVGGLVATKNGFRPLALEGFSEDVNQDGFVDPIAPAVAAPLVAAAPAVYAHAPVVAPAVAPAVHVAAAPLPYVGPTLSHSPVVTSVKAVEVKPAEVEVEAPKVISYAAPAVYHHAPAAYHHVPAAVPYTHHVPVSQTYTQTIPLGVQRHVVTTHHVAGLPGVVAPVAVAAAEPEAQPEAVVEA